jgi:hypothetical protein
MRRASLLLGCFGILVADPLPEALERFGARFWRQLSIGLQALDDSLDNLFGKAVSPGFPLPVIEHFGEAADDGRVVIAVAMFEIKKFAKFF